MKGLRPIVPLARDLLRGVSPAEDRGEVPVFEWVDPRSLFVEKDYQRDVGEAGINLIRRIYANFRWSRFKPPICVRMPEFDAVVCIDGQHTAIAAASHPQIDKIPVMVVGAATAAERASAFVGHNRERVTLTPVAIYRAEVASGDPVATRVAEACRLAGAEVVPALPYEKRIGVTVAVGTLRNLARKHDAAFLARTLSILVHAGRAPLKAAEIAAVAIVLKEIGFEGLDECLIKVIASRSMEEWMATGITAGHNNGQRLGPALASLWMTELVKGSAAARAVAALARDNPPEPPKPLPAPPPRKVAREKPPSAAPQKPRDAPSPPARPVQPCPPKSNPEQVLHLNGVKLDLGTWVVEHAGRAARIHRADGVKIVGHLLKVMPAFLDAARLASKIEADLDSLRLLVDDVNIPLRSAGLEIKPVGKMGYTLGTADGRQPEQPAPARDAQRSRRSS